MKCAQQYELKVLKSAAGFFIGTADEDGSVNCRISHDYFDTKEEAQKALNTRSFKTRMTAIENQFCFRSCGADRCF